MRVAILFDVKMGVEGGTRDVRVDEKSVLHHLRPRDKGWRGGREGKGQTSADPEARAPSGTE